MTKDEKLAAVDKLLGVYRGDLQEARSREEEWGREAAYYQRMADLLNTHTERAAQDIAWLEAVRQEIELGKL